MNSIEAFKQWLYDQLHLDKDLWEEIKLDYYRRPIDSAGYTISKGEKHADPSRII